MHEVFPSFSQKNLGYATINIATNGPEQEVNLIRHNQIPPDFDAFHSVKQAHVLSSERQWYFYEEVRMHIQENAKRDIYCPLSSVSKPKKVVQKFDQLEFQFLL
ncbi:12423_t:CDS:2 [Ambispora gerdemannii]|uniref:12423_t:CDS:1 n=1 Tax=Ambispora gerdemannii TaxID=144530 RepID=A0A9N9B665_9GLOM|nr:12423_t:CDS:2 [Ambispora gerdemannii]